MNLPALAYGGTVGDCYVSITLDPGERWEAVVHGTSTDRLGRSVRRMFDSLDEAEAWVERAVPIVTEAERLSVESYQLMNDLKGHEALVT